MKSISTPSNDDSYEYLNELELFRLMTQKNNKALADKAYTIFYYKYYNYIWKICNNACNNFSTISNLTDDIFQDTMFKIYSKSDYFVQKLSEDNINIQKRTKALCGKIAQNCFFDFFRNNEFDKINDGNLISLDNTKEYESDIIMYSLGLIEDNEQDNITPNHILYEEAFDLLNEKRRDVMAAYNMKNGKKMSPEIMEDLCKKWDTNPENIRQIKVRAEKQIKEYIVKNKSQ